MILLTKQLFYLKLNVFAFNQFLKVESFKANSVETIYLS